MPVIVLPISATIVSYRNGIDPVQGASREDLQVGDVVALESYSNATTYAWSFVYKPAGSTATFSGSSTAKNPGNFTVDAIGSYLVKLIVDAGLATEDEQVVRLRRLSALGQKLPGAGEYKNNTNSVPVDVSASGWTNDMNANLLLLENAIGGGSGITYIDETIVFTVGVVAIGGYYIYDHQITGLSASSVYICDLAVFSAVTGTATQIGLVAVTKVPNPASSIPAQEQQAALLGTFSSPISVSSLPVLDGFTGTYVGPRPGFSGSAVAPAIVVTDASGTLNIRASTNVASSGFTAQIRLRKVSA